jgi:hypothetical protein
MSLSQTKYKAHREQLVQLIYYAFQDVLLEVLVYRVSSYFKVTEACAGVGSHFECVLRRRQPMI